MLTSEDGESEPLRGPLQAAVHASAAAAPLSDRDRAAALLAETIARDIDLAGDLSKLGPQLLRVLDALQLTPKSRGVAQRGGGGGERPSDVPDELGELRRRRARKRDAAAVDAAAPPAD